MKKELKAFGLNDNEIEVYKACLELGSSPVTRIAQRAKIYRTLAYEVLKSLLEKGLVSYVVKNKKKSFEAAPPKTFISLLKEKQRAIENILPHMTAMQNSIKEKPAITLYEGKEGIKTVLENLLSETKYFYGVSPKKAMEKVLRYYFPNFVEKRVKSKIKVKLIMDEKPLTQKLLEYKIVKEKVSSGYWTYHNKVLIFSFDQKNPLAIVIENKEFAQSMHIMFNLSWKGTNRQK